MSGQVELSIVTPSQPVKVRRLHPHANSINHTQNDDKRGFYVWEKWPVSVQCSLSETCYHVYSVCDFIFLT
jgi:hypothetical protein